MKGREGEMVSKSPNCLMSFDINRVGLGVGLR